MQRIADLSLRDFPRCGPGAWGLRVDRDGRVPLPTMVLGLLVYFRPELVLSMVDAQPGRGVRIDVFEHRRSDRAERTADTDWAMFGYYIRHNIGLAFQCFAGGLFAGVGSLFFLAFNGAFFGALAGYLTERGLASTFYSFVVTHAAFELTAIVLSGAAGLRLGHALLAPGRFTRSRRWSTRRASPLS